MPTSKLTGALSAYDNASQKVTLLDFIKENLLVVATVFICVFLAVLLVVQRLFSGEKRKGLTSC